MNSFAQKCIRYYKNGVRVHNAKISTLSVCAIASFHSLTVSTSQIHCHSFICPARQLFIFSFFPALLPFSRLSRSHIADKFQFDTISTVVFYNAIWINTKRALMLMCYRSFGCWLACLLAHLFARFVHSRTSFTIPLNISIATILMTKHFAHELEQLKQLNTGKHTRARTHARTHERTHIHTFMIFYFHTAQP